MASNIELTPEAMSARLFAMVVMGTVGFFVAMALIFFFMKG